MITKKNDKNYFPIPNEIFQMYSNLKTKLLSSPPTIETNVDDENFIIEILKDDSLLFFLDNINILTHEEANLIYKIIKIIIFCSCSDSEVSVTKQINAYLQIKSEKLIQILLNNLIPSNKDYIVIIVGKTIRKFSLVDFLLEKVLSKFGVIYSLTKNENFVLSQECFKILFHLIGGKRINKQITSKFLSENSQLIFTIINGGINLTGLSKQNKSKECLVDDFYYMKRETLILIEKILCEKEYEQFTNIFLNNTENLKCIMMQLNNKCERIVFQAIDILYFFFLDIETKDTNIKLILKNNKDNFYKFFEKNEEIFSHDSDLMEKKSFILYELERLENYLDI